MKVAKQRAFLVYARHFLLWSCLELFRAYIEFINLRLCFVESFQLKFFAHFSQFLLISSYRLLAINLSTFWAKLFVSYFLTNTPVLFFFTESTIPGTIYPATGVPIELASILTK